MGVDFGELRSLLQRPQSEHTWFALQKLLESWEPISDEELSSKVFPYARDHLQRWPIELCFLRVEELSLWRRAVKRPWFPLTRTLSLAGECVHFLDLAAERPHSIESLGITGVDRRGILELARSPVCDHVFALDLSGNQLSDDDLIVWLEDQNTRGLRMLDLSENDLTEEIIPHLGESGLLDQLEVLSLAGNQLGYGGVELMEELLKDHLLECDLSQNGADTSGSGRNEVGWRSWEQFTDLDEWEKWSEWDREEVSWRGREGDRALDDED